MNLDWDDLRYFLALHRNGTLSAAGRALGVNHATVGRRVDALEEAAGTSLFDKLPDGWELTARGQALLEPALAAERGHLAVSRALLSSDDALAGTVKIACSQLLAAQVVLPFVTELQKTEPAITLELLEGVGLVSLPRHEADLGLRMWREGRVPGADAVKSVRVADLQWRLFASREFVAGRTFETPIVRLGDLPFIAYTDDAPTIPGEEWLRSDAVNEVMRCSSMYTVAAAVRAHLGVGILPDPLARREGFVPLSEPLMQQSVWLAIHPDLKGNRRIRTVYEALGEFARDRTDLFDPLEP